MPVTLHVMAHKPEVRMGKWSERYGEYTPEFLVPELMKSSGGVKIFDIWCTYQHYRVSPHLWYIIFQCTIIAANNTAMVGFRYDCGRIAPVYNSSSSSGKGWAAAMASSCSYCCWRAWSIWISGGASAGASTKVSLSSPTSLRASQRNGFSNW